MKLFAWQPKGHGQLSFFICAETKEQAASCIGRYIKKGMENDDESRNNEYYVRGWGTDYYELTEVDPLTVITNAND